VTTARTGRWSFSFSCTEHSAPCKLCCMPAKSGQSCTYRHSAFVSQPLGKSCRERSRLAAHNSCCTDRQAGESNDRSYRSGNGWRNTSREGL
jgi:hypothetical protein